MNWKMTRRKQVPLVKDPEVGETVDTEEQVDNRRDDGEPPVGKRRLAGDPCGGAWRDFSRGLPREPPRPAATATAPLASGIAHLPPNSWNESP